jgi:predicted nucleotidyltransferase/DNA-binding transcriptional ArsR family regulator
MDLSEPASMVMSHGHIALLRVLSGTEETFTVRELSRLAGVSPAYTAKVIGQLTEHGLVLAEKKGGIKLCQLNHAHLAAKAIVELVRLRARLHTLLIEEITAWPLAPFHASLFGSAARGDGDVHSDLDILLIRPNKKTFDNEQWSNQLFTTSMDLKSATGNEVSWLDITMADLKKTVQAKEPIVAEWQKDSVRLSGPSFRSLLRQAS